MKIITLITCLSFFITGLFGQDISGLWQGVLYQGIGGVAPYFKFSMNLIQSGNSITGYSRIETVGSPYWGVMPLTGSLNNANNIFTFQETSIDSQLVSGFFWCIKNGNLNYDPAMEKLDGRWSAGSCSPGKIELWRLKITSKTNFCSNEKINVKVTGENVKWYSDYQLRNLIGTGNSFSPNITSSTTLFVTQTHFNTESPPFAININILLNSTNSLNMSICQGETYRGYNTTGIYIDTLQAVNGCDSLEILNLTVLPSVSSTESVNICQGEAYERYSAAGIYIDTLRATNGCDSVLTLNLTVLPRQLSTQTVNICQGDIYEGYNKSGIYMDTLQATNGCDSIKVLNLLVNPTYQINESITICAGAGYDFLSKLISKEGIYKDTITTVMGCDSVIVLDLKIAKSNFLGVDTTLCIASDYLLTSPSDNTLWYDGSKGGNKIVEKSGSYWAAILDANGCEIRDTTIVQFSNKIFVPNVFSPNGDAVNDCFKPYISDLDIKSYRFSIFDRWGNQLFSTTNPAGYWDGTSEGKQCNSGTYFYFIEVETESCKKQVLKGAVSILK